MSSTATIIHDLCLPVPQAEWIDRLPEGAVSIETDGPYWRLRASQSLQTRYEDLLERRRSGLLTDSENQEYAAICELDQLLSGFNRLARRVQQG